MSSTSELADEYFYITKMLLSFSGSPIDHSTKEGRLIESQCRVMVRLLNILRSRIRLAEQDVNLNTQTPDHQNLSSRQAETHYSTD